MLISYFSSDLSGTILILISISLSVFVPDHENCGDTVLYPSRLNSTLAVLSTVKVSLPPASVVYSLPSATTFTPPKGAPFSSVTAMRIVAGLWFAATLDSVLVPSVL